MDHVTNLDYDEKPDYSYVRNLFVDHIDKDIDTSFMYDWDIQRNRIATDSIFT